MTEIDNVEPLAITKRPFNSEHGLLLVLAVWTAIVLVGHFRYAPPLPKSVDIPDDQFSAWRADAHLKLLIADGIPHPAGSPQNDLVRERIVSLLQSWGYETVIQETDAPPRSQRAGDKKTVPLENVMVRLPGEASTGAVMLASHYDSVPAGPGASDDGIGVAATLEIAKIFSTIQPKNDVVFLITDGEEFGLLGANRWMNDHPWADDVRVAINLEARGTDGPSLMFQTSENSLWLIKRFADVVQRPMTSSLFYEIYRRLPNDTDFTEFVAGGIEGYNFAIIGDVKNYHTPNDNYEMVNRGCLQHHGDNALALLRELSSIDLRNQPPGRAVYFDLFGWQVFWWPEHWSLWISLVAIVLLGSVAVLEKSISLVRLVAGVGLVLFIMGLVVLVSLLLGSGFALDQRFESVFPKQPIAIEMSYWFAALLSLVIVVPVLPGFQQLAVVLISVLTVWAAAAITTSITLAGASYLFVIPVAVSVLLSVALVPRNRLYWAACALPIVGGFIWLPLERLFYDAIGLPSALLLGIRIAIALSLLVPLISTLTAKSRLTLSALSVVGFVGSVLIALIANKIT